MKDPVTEAVGLPDISPHEFGRIRTAILTDNLVYNRVLARLVDEAAPGVIAALHPLEKKRLRERLGFVEKPPVQTWSLDEALSDGHPYVTAKCETCRQSLTFPAPRHRVEFRHDAEKQFPVTVARVRGVLDLMVFQHCGKTETPPRDFLAAVERRFMACVGRVPNVG